jgi:hypothetical protein
VANAMKTGLAFGILAFAIYLNIFLPLACFWFCIALAIERLILNSCFVRYALRHKEHSIIICTEDGLWQQEALLQNTYGLALTRIEQPSAQILKEYLTTHPETNSIYIEPSILSVTELDEIAHISHKYRKDNKLKKLPSLKRIFFREGNESVIVNMSEELDMLAEEMGNSKNKKVIIYINELPIIEAKAITSPIDNKWLNILAIIVFPIGTAIYIRACIYRLRLLRDLIKLEQTSKKLIEILVKEKLV